MVELGKYQRCQELRGFMKKNQFRLVLIRRSGTKVSELKFQVNDAEEKDSWLRALNEAIEEANNKEFDQVTVDEKSSLDHLTRNRARINHSRRPPTRQHRKEVASAMSSGIQRLELGAQTLIIEESTDEAQLKEKEGEGLGAEGRTAEEGEGLPVKEGEGPPAEEGEVGSCTRETISDLLKNEGESDFQTKASTDTNEMEKQQSETNSNSSLNRANLPRVKCASLGDILSESKQQLITKQFDTYGNLKNTNVEKMESSIAFELKVTRELLQQVSGKDAAVEQHLQSTTTQDNWSTRSAARLLNDAMAKWSEADKVLQELKDLKELYKKPETLTSEESERRKNLLTFYRRSVP
ncbi:hypothetical protein chiPu_0015242 [Chiloscyllium punctatum]|uniref:PH domain-containing protein n=1 Tax=Chiloscyllium punctatum TaxID=137246 RepID=A0A401T2A8_CHIPU|nr:hypothetical protein [Chiloscyllium punctatum]